MSELAEQVRAERAESHSTELDIDIAGVRLSGWLHQVQDDGLLRWRPATLSAVDGILLWLEHGVLLRRRHRREPHVWPQEFRTALCRAGARRAQAQLAELLAGYQRGLSQPLLLLNKSGWAWLSQCYLPETQEIDWEEEAQIKARAKLLQARQGDQRISGEGEDPTCSGCSANWIMNTWRKYWPKQSVICCRWRGITRGNNPRWCCAAGGGKITKVIFNHWGNSRSYITNRHIPAVFRAATLAKNPASTDLVMWF